MLAGMPGRLERYFEDYTVGQKFGSGTVTVTAERIKSFAREFDPQPFHTDEEAARHTFFGGLVASGWHTAAMSMRLFVESDITPRGGSIGAGGSDLAWPRPTRPGDVLRVESEVVEVIPSRSKPERGMVVMRCETKNQHGDVLQRFSPKLVVSRRQVPDRR